jgi:hypothetical protein
MVGMHSTCPVLGHLHSLIHPHSDALVAIAHYSHLVFVVGCPCIGELRCVLVCSPLFGDIMIVHAGDVLPGGV